MYVMSAVKHVLAAVVVSAISWLILAKIFLGYSNMLFSSWWSISGFILAVIASLAAITWKMDRYVDSNFQNQVVEDFYSEISVLEWRVLNAVFAVLSVVAAVAAIVLVALELANEERVFLFSSWVHMVPFGLFGLGTLSMLRSFLDDRVPSSVRARQMLRAERKQMREAQRQNESKLTRANNKADALSFGAIAGLFVGKGQADKGSYSVSFWTSRKGTRSGSSYVYDDKNEAVSKAYEHAKRYPDGEVEVKDQTTQQIVLRLP